MPTEKRKLAQLENEKKKVARTSKSITSFFTKNDSSRVTDESISGSEDNDLVEMPAAPSTPSTPKRSFLSGHKVGVNKDWLTSGSEDNDLVEMPAAPSTPSRPRRRFLSGHKVGVNNDWLTQYNWLYFDTEEDDDNNSVDVMMCKLCKKHKSHCANGSKTWSEVGYRLLRKDKLQMHQDSDQHKYSVTLEMAKNLDQMATNINTSAQKAIQDAMKVLYFILQNNLSLEIFRPTLDLCIDVGATDLPKLRLAKNATYSSWDTVHELLDVLSEKVQQLLLESLRDSPCYSTMVDEVMDNRTIKHLAICTRFIDSTGQPQTAFLTDREVPNATANSIINTIKTVIKDSELSIKDMAGFASDGAAVFTGSKTGVAKQLKDDNPQLLTHHCRDHRLALACRDSFAKIPQMKKLDQMLEALYKYYKYSVKNHDSLKSVQKAFSEAPLTIKQAKHHRWLSHEQAVSSVVRSYRSLVVDLESSEISNDPVGHGLLKSLKDPSMLRALLLLADILPHITNLSLTFQRRDVHLGNIKHSLDKTTTILEKRKTQPGPWLLKEDQLRADVNISDTVPTSFQSKVQHPFLDQLIHNIKTRFEDADIIDQLSILDLTNTEDIPTMYGYTEIEALADKFDMEPETLLLQWHDFTQLLTTSGIDNRSLQHLHGLFHSPEHKEKNLKQMYPLIAQLYSIALVQPLSTAEVERVFSQVKLIKTSHRSNLKTTTLTKILSIKYNCDQALFNRIIDDCVMMYFSRKNRRLVSIV